MKFTVVTILPELVEPALAAGVVGRARDAGTIEVATINPRDFTTDRHRTVDDESHSAGLLEYPQYTRPPRLGDREVPPVLVSGNHAAIAAWRRRQAIERTARRRADLFARFVPEAADRIATLAARTYLALVHHPVVDRTGAVVTTSLTNFDIHDLARSTRTYGLAGYYIVTPITQQRDKAEHIARLWEEEADGSEGDRAHALALVKTAGAIDTVIAELLAEHGTSPLVVATSARC